MRRLASTVTRSLTALAQPSTTAASSAEPCLEQLVVDAESHARVSTNEVSATRIVASARHVSACSGVAPAVSTSRAATASAGCLSSLSMARIAAGTSGMPRPR